MQIKKFKLLIALALIFLISPAVIVLSEAPTVGAQFRGVGEAGGTPGPLASGVVPDIQVNTWALISARPTTVGLG